MSLQQRGMVRFYKAFNNNPEALIRLLSVYIAGEERSELNSPILSLARHLPDSPLRTLIRRHVGDEGRHAKLFRNRIKELGGVPYPIPRELEPQEQYLGRGGFLDSYEHLPPEEVTRTDRVIEILLYNSVLEDFVLSRFMAHAEAAADEDPRTYFMMMDVIADEIRHVVYTQEHAYKLAGTARYELARSRHKQYLEAQAKYGARTFRLLFDHLFPREVLKLSRAEYLAWQGVARVQELIGAPVPHRMPVAHPEKLVHAA